MKRREFITLLGGTAAAWPLAASAQQADRTRRVGVLMLYPENDPEGQVRAVAFQQGLENLGWTVGRNIQIDYVWGEGDNDWARAAAAELLRLAPDVILANGSSAVRPMQQATRTVPIIFIGGADPVGDGFVKSLAHPGWQPHWLHGVRGEHRGEVAGAAQGDRADSRAHRSHGQPGQSQPSATV